MDEEVSIASVAALVADAARARMLTALMDGRARTAKELAYGARVTPQTASCHLAKLLAAGLLAMERVAHAIEALMAVSSAPPRAARAAPAGPLEGLRLARTCYDHLAGRLGVSVTDAMVRRRWLTPGERDYGLTATGARGLARLGVDVDETRRERRAFAQRCLDWSERRTHLAGSLGAAVARRCLELHWVQRVAEERTLRLTAKGRRGLRTWFGIAWPTP